jgi:hypothetical protein
MTRRACLGGIWTSELAMIRGNFVEFYFNYSFDSGLGTLEFIIFESYNYFLLCFSIIIIFPETRKPMSGWVDGWNGVANTTARPMQRRLLEQPLAFHWTIAFPTTPQAISLPQLRSRQSQRRGR